MSKKPTQRRDRKNWRNNLLYAYALVAGAFTWLTLIRLYPHNTITYVEPNTPWLIFEILVTSTGFALILAKVKDYLRPTPELCNEETEI